MKELYPPTYLPTYLHYLCPNFRHGFMMIPYIFPFPFPLGPFLIELIGEQFGEAEIKLVDR